MTKVCVVCPTCNRQHFIPMVIHQFQMQDYEQKERILIIYDDTPGEDAELSVQFFEEHGCDMTNVVYRYNPEKKTIYEKRNELNRLAIEEYDAEYVVCMDDDDLYLPNRVTTAVNALSKAVVSSGGGCDNSGGGDGVRSVIAGSNVLHLLYADTGEIYEVRVKNSKYASNNTMAYNRKYAESNKHTPSYESQNNNEEDSFTNGFREPMVQLRYTVLMLCHDHNTVNKTRFRVKRNKVSPSKKKALLNMFIGRNNTTKLDFYARYYPQILKSMHRS